MSPPFQWALHEVGLNQLPAIRSNPLFETVQFQFTSQAKWIGHTVKEGWCNCAKRQGSGRGT